MMQMSVGWRGMAPTILITQSLNWPNGARLAMAFREAGCHVYALSPAGHPLRTVTALDGSFDYNPFFPLRSLDAAIMIAEPDIIVPCDDQMVRHLHRLYHRLQHASSLGSSLAQLIERSLGAP